ncbi:pilus assembly PilX family protein [Roseateles sp. NT4]|uniref:pilus assembly PilX family protein n=1 Tax=Roseateles sp. NT4 TaxID=3453715 RepID=UPI003EED0493
MAVMMRTTSSSRLLRRQQRGIVLIFALITLVILLIGAVAISRSINSSQFAVGNIGFKRDLTNQGERALQAAMDAVRAGGQLDTVTKRNANLLAANYSATLLPTNAQGIPTALLASDTAFAAVGTAADITPAGTGVTIRYVIDRLSTAAGACTSATCTMVNQSVFGGSSSEWINSQTNSGAANNANPSAVPEQPIFRITVRVKGPRNTLSFFQSTFTTN